MWTKVGEMFGLCLGVLLDFLKFLYVYNFTKNDSFMSQITKTYAHWCCLTICVIFSLNVLQPFVSSAFCCAEVES